MKHPARHRILLTGASGALSHALLRHLAGHDLISLDQRDTGTSRPLARADGDIRISIGSDISSQSLGLPPQTYDDLVAWATVVIHITSGADPTSCDIERTSVDGARNLAQFAEQADALLLYVSTAFVHASGGTLEGPRSFLTAAFRAEGAARASSSRWTIVRTSLVIGDPKFASVPGHQEDQEAAAGSPVGPPSISTVEPWWLLDAIHQDVAARALVALLDGRSAGETVWLTSGKRALTLEQLCAVTAQVVQTHPTARTTHHLPETALHDRVLAQFSVAGLFPSAWTAIAGLREGLPVYMFRPDALPTSVPDLLGIAEDALPDVAAMYLRYLSQWVDECAPSAAAS